MKLNTETFQLTEKGRFGNLALIVGAVGLILSAVGYVLDPKQFFHSYLVSFAYWTSIGLGGLFFVLLHHLVGATWSIVLRRLTENVMAALPIMLLFAVPLALGMHDLYHWSHAEAVEHDAILKEKSGYLNPTFFVIRTVGYFAVWLILARLLNKYSDQQDKGENTTSRLMKVSAPGMILFAFTITYAAFDWMMSLEPHWYSTIYGVWYFSGSLLTFLCFLVIVGLYLRKKGVLHETIKVDHYHDLGKLMFAFTIFWAYIAFSQYFLIWYANIPEETVYYLKRWEGSWQTVSLLLVFGHLTLPWLALVTRAAKRNLLSMKLIAGWLLLMHWFDLHWAIMPNLHPSGFTFSWMDVATFVGLGGMFLWYFWYQVCSRPLIPVKDPQLSESLQLVNH